MKFDIQQFIEASKLSSMDHWFPLTKDLPIPQPRTEVALRKGTDSWMSFIDEPELFDGQIKHLKDKASEIGYPLFMRTDQASAKHSYIDTCKVESEDRLLRNIYNLIEENIMCDLNIQTLYFRDFIELDSVFTAFNKMPIAPERRYFVKDGEVLCHHPYWESGKQWVASVIQAPALIKDFLTQLNNIGWDTFPVESSEVTPPIHRLSGWPLDILSGSNVFLQLYKKFGLTALDRKEGQQNPRYIGCLRGRYIPIKKRLTILSSGFYNDRGSTIKSQMKEIDSISLDLLDLDSCSKADITLSPSVNRILLSVDSETTVSIKDSSEIGYEVWVFFHVLSHMHTMGDNTLKTCDEKVVCTILSKGPIDGHTNEPNYMSLLDKVNTESSEEVTLLKIYASMISRAVPGCWSVDFAQAKNGVWYFIDMADARLSWHPEDCKNYKELSIENPDPPRPCTIELINDDSNEDEITKGEI